VVDSALRGVEGELCGQPAREGVLVALERLVAVAAGVAEFAQLLVCLSRPPPVLVRPIGWLGRIEPRLPPAPRRQRPSPASKKHFRLALQVGSERGVSFPVLGQGDGQTPAVLIERARNPAPSTATGFGEDEDCSGPRCSGR
jgi:hypothetical protein